MASTSASSTTNVLTAAMLGSLRRLLEQAELDELDAVADGDAPRFHDLAVHTESEVLLPGFVRGHGTVRGERAQRVEVRDACLGILVVVGEPPTSPRHRTDGPPMRTPRMIQ